MNHLNVIKLTIQDYLNSPNTDYALMISGEWGSGKTYFWKKFVKEVEQEKKYIYISLNGLQNLMEIENLIVFRSTISENIKDPNQRLSNLNKVIDSALTLANNNQVLKTFKDITLNLVKQEIFDNAKNNLILCFDDLERCQINIDNTLGYINKFVELYQIKTIIICNESEINSENANYSKIKEKLVGHTFEIKPDLEEIIQHFTKDYDCHIRDAIINNKEVIFEVIKASEKQNIRIVKSTLSLLENILKSIPSPETDFNNKSTLGIKKFDIIKEIIKFSFALNFELKIGKIDQESLFEIKELLQYLWSYEKVIAYMLADYKRNAPRDSQKNNEDKNLNNKIYAVEFLERYYELSFGLLHNFGNFPPFSFLSVFEYIKSGYFNKENFISEFNKIQSDSVKKDEIFCQFDYRIFEDDEFENLSEHFMKEIYHKNVVFDGDLNKILTLLSRLYLFAQDNLISLKSFQVKCIKCTINEYLLFIDSNATSFKPLDFYKRDLSKPYNFQSYLIYEITKISNRIEEHDFITRVESLLSKSPQDFLFEIGQLAKARLEMSLPFLSTIQSQNLLEKLEDKVMNFPNRFIDDFYLFLRRYYKDFDAYVDLDINSLTHLRDEIRSSKITNDSKIKLSESLFKQIVDFLDERINEVQSDHQSHQT
jgi:hypothetical protein